MKTNHTAIRIVAGVLPAMALFATSTSAQDAAPAPAPPLVTQTTPPPTSAAAAPTQAAPTATASGPSAADQARYQASLDAATKTPAPNAPTPAVPNRSAIRTTPTRAVPARAVPVQIAAPAAPASVAPATPTPPAAAVAPPLAAPATAPAAATETTTARTRSGQPTWLWLVGGLIVLGALGLGALLLRRRRADVYAEDWADEPVATAAEPAYEPAIVAPALDEAVVAHADVGEPQQAEVAAMTDASAPVAGRPWIELSLHPVRAGATEDAALVDLELTLANAGEVEARDVTVTTFMLGDANDASSNMEALLAQSDGGTEVEAGAIGAGEGSRIDARVTVARDGMAGATFQPLVGVDVRYKLPDGRVGRTAAAFTVGVQDGSEDPTPLRLGGDMREDVEAVLHGMPERV